MSYLLLGGKIGKTKQLGCHQRSGEIFLQPLMKGIGRDARNYSQEATAALMIARKRKSRLRSIIRKLAVNPMN
jgi:hypothetical protein